MFPLTARITDKAKPPISFLYMFQGLVYSSSCKFDLRITNCYFWSMGTKRMHMARISHSA